MIFSVSAVEGMLNMDIGNVIKVVDANGVDTLTMIEMVEGLREAFHQWVGMCLLLIYYILCEIKSEGIGILENCT